MEKENLLKRNLLALSSRHRELCSRLQGADGSTGHYTFLESRSGELIPAHKDKEGINRPLHSMIDPGKEAKRLIDAVEDYGFLILLGLGGGFYAEAALENENLCTVLVIEYGLGSLKDLLFHRDYGRLFEDPRFLLLVDPGEEELKRFLLDHYQPLLHGGIRVIPLHSRTNPGAMDELGKNPFSMAAGAIQAAIDSVSGDYSVQAHFGMRWFSNIIRNLEPAFNCAYSLPNIHRAAITAAGPSLSWQINSLREKRKERFIIATDTSLPCLLAEGLIPDAVISMDCQHISYYHFMDGIPEGVLLFLDLASPPLLHTRSGSCIFYTGGHPLGRYISSFSRPLLELDTSGGNVTYAALSLAEQLGAREIEVYGADFSYPQGLSYARGAYIHTLFAKAQNRLSTLEAQSSAFLFRTPFEKKTRPDNSECWYYETKTLAFYRQRLEEKSRFMAAEVIPVAGGGAPISIPYRLNPQWGTIPFTPVKAKVGLGEFLESYKKEIRKLPEPGKRAADYPGILEQKGEALRVFTTMLPLAAAIKWRNPEMGFRELVEETKARCLKEIEV